MKSLLFVIKQFSVNSEAQYIMETLLLFDM